MTYISSDTNVVDVNGTFLRIVGLVLLQFQHLRTETGNILLLLLIRM